MSYVIDTPEAIDAFRLSMVIRALRTEVETGMKMTRISALKVARRDYGVKSRTKKGAIIELEALQKEATA